MGIESFFTAHIFGGTGNASVIPTDATPSDVTGSEKNADFLDMLFAKLDSKNETPENLLELTDENSAPSSSPENTILKALITQTPDDILSTIENLKDDLRVKIDNAIEAEKNSESTKKLEILFNIIDENGREKAEDKDGDHKVNGLLNLLREAKTEREKAQGTFFNESYAELQSDSQEIEAFFVIPSELTPSETLESKDLESNDSNASIVAAASSILFTPPAFMADSKSFTNSKQSNTKSTNTTDTQSKELGSRNDYSQALQDRILGTQTPQDADAKVSTDKTLKPSSEKGEKVAQSAKPNLRFSAVLEPLTLTMTQADIEAMSLYTTDTLGKATNAPSSTLAVLSSTLTQSSHATHAHPASQLVSLKVQKMAGNNENRQFTIQLDPPELGKIEVKMDFGADKKMKTVLTVEKPETYAMLQRDAHGLEKSLQDMGLELDNGMEFTLADSGHDFMNDNKRGGGHDHTGAHGSSDDGLDENNQEILVSGVDWVIDPNTGHTRYDFYV